MGDAFLPAESAAERVTLKRFYDRDDRDRETNVGRIMKHFSIRANGAEDY